MQAKVSETMNNRRKEFVTAVLSFREMMPMLANSPKQSHPTPQRRRTDRLH
jgi:hypothetical protein